MEIQGHTLLQTQYHKRFCILQRLRLQLDSSHPLNHPLQ